MSMDDAKEKLRITFMKIMNCKQIKLFGALIYKFRTRILDDPKLTAFIYFNGKEPNIVFGKDLVMRHNVKQLTFIMLHEMLHFINSHHRRGSKYDRMVANMAADHVVNEILLKDLGKVEIQNSNGHDNHTRDVLSDVAEPCSDPEPFYVKELLGKENMTYEAVYEWLMKNKVQYYEVSEQCSSCGGSGSSGKSKSDKDGENEEGEGEGEGEGCPDCQNGNYGGKNDGKKKYKVKIKGKGEFDYTPDIDDSTENKTSKEQDEAADGLGDELKNDLRSIINGSKNSELTRGMEGGVLLEFIKELTKVVIPWDELLEIAIKNHVIPSMENRSWKNPMKRFRSHGITIPGMGTDVTASNMVIVIDTSGSIGSDDLQKFMGICSDALVHFDRIITIQHDHGIKKVVEVDKDDMSAFEEACKVVGRGGTSHTEVFEYIEKELWHNDEEVGLVIMLTDFYSDVVENWESGKFNWPSEYPVKVVLNHSQVNMVPAFVDQHPIVIREQD